MEKNFTHPVDTLNAACSTSFNINEVLATICKTVEIETQRKGWGLSRDDQADIVQDACIKAWRYKESFDPAKSKLSTWASTIARNAIKDYIERNSVPMKSSDEYDDDDPAKELIAMYPELGDTYQPQSTSRFVPLEYRRFCDGNGKSKESEWFLSPKFEAIASGRGADFEVEWREAGELAQQAIDNLPENQRFIVGLVVSSMKPRQIAGLIGCSPNAASGILFRARKALKKYLGIDFLLDHGFAA